ncbi:AmmeMemoRadiSam system protein A [Endothiovibrio diazotrophicus]
MSSTEPNHGPRYDPQQRATMLRLVRDAIAHALTNGRARPFVVDPEDYPEALRAERASFVTLTIGGELRGCIGTLEAHRPLVNDLASNARSAAFSDPRFPPLSPAEFQALEIHVSILQPAEPMCFTSESDLLGQLRPGVDGLILEDHGRRGTFLPSVWEQLPTPEQFLRHLKQKAGLPPDHWSDTLRVSRYTTESFGE